MLRYIECLKHRTHRLIHQHYNFAKIFCKRICVVCAKKVLLRHIYENM